MTDNRPAAELLGPDHWHADSLTTLRVNLNDWQATEVSLTRDQLQTIVNAAATQYGITPDAFEGPKEDCPEHDRACGICDIRFSRHDNNDCHGDFSVSR